MHDRGSQNKWQKPNADDSILLCRVWELMHCRKAFPKHAVTPHHDPIQTEPDLPQGGIYCVTQRWIFHKMPVIYIQCIKQLSW